MARKCRAFVCKQTRKNIRISCFTFRAPCITGYSAWNLKIILKLVKVSRLLTSFLEIKKKQRNTNTMITFLDYYSFTIPSTRLCHLCNNLITEERSLKYWTKQKLRSMWVNYIKRVYSVVIVKVSVSNNSSLFDFISLHFYLHTCISSS